MYLGNSRILLGEGNQKDLYIGGGFTGRVSKWDGSSWKPLVSGFSAGVVFTLFPYKNSLITGGTFSTISGSSINHLAKWNGYSFSEFEGGASSTVYDITEDPSKNLYVGGEFTTIGGVSANRIAKWDGSSWSAFSGGAGGAVLSIHYHDGVIWNTGGAAPNHPYQLYITGLFTTVDGSSISRIARWNGSVWQGLSTGLNNTGRDIIVYNNDLYVCGNFTQAGGVPRLGIAKWDGDSWSGVSTGLNGTAYSMAIFRGELVVTGEFTTAGGVTAYRIAKWNGTSWSALGSGIGGTGGVTTLRYGSKLLVYNNKLYVVGSGIGSTISDNQVKIWDGSSWSDLGTSPDNTVYTITSL
jgi:hypothetical protein